MSSNLYTNEGMQLSYQIIETAGDEDEYLYHSTEYKDISGTSGVFDDGDKVKVINNGTYDANDDGNNKNDINFEELFTFYLVTQNPVAFEAIHFPFT
jgi:hypothetical protein